jgi:hypothetical protein
MPGETIAKLANFRIRWKNWPNVVHSTRKVPAWIIAFHRFAEVSIGTAAALLLATKSSISKRPIYSGSTLQSHTNHG